MHIKGAIFDADGTLFDSMPVWYNVGIRYLESRGITPDENLTEKVASMSLMEAAEFFQTEYSIKDSYAEIIGDINRLIETAYFHEIGLKKGVKNYLEKIHNGGVKMCVATSTDQYLIKAALERCGVLKYFTEVLTCGMVGKGKTKPDIYEKALEIIGTDKEDTVVYEDALYALKTAKGAGFYTVGVHDDAEKKQDELKSLADRYILSFDEERDNYEKDSCGI